ncbi:MAG: ATP-binding cassette domain-containing protein [Candidatus Atribacteria bacterium]|nr:ATP-binding cassette domain-containing protein [Candidatus Atribacteria bacterium]
MGTLVEMKGIYKLFGGLCAINNVDLTIGKGEVIGLVGDNAAGKSTLMKVLSGVYPPTEGDIFVEGQQKIFKSPHDARNVGVVMLFQDLALVQDLDVTDNIFLGKELPKRIFGQDMRFLLDRRTMDERSEKFLRELEINVDSIKEKVKNLSGGQRQSVSIARTIFFNARLVILDEPTSAISVKETQKVLDLILQLKKKGVAVIIVSHRMEDIFNVADRVVVLRRGKKVEDIEKCKTTPELIIKRIIGLNDGAGCNQ